MNSTHFRRRTLLTVLFCLAAGLSFPASSGAYMDITPDSLYSWLKSSNKPYVLDVREQSEYLERHIEGAVLFPLNSGILNERWNRLPSSGPIVAVCKGGSRAAQAAAYLETVTGGNFYGRLYRLVGGMDAWHYEDVKNDYSSYVRQRVLLEMFTASWCASCYTSNKYLDDSIVPFAPPLALIRYHVGDTGFISADERALFLDQQTTPDLFINGATEIYPDYLTLTMIGDARKDSSSLWIDIYGKKPTATDSGLVRVQLKAKPKVVMTPLRLFVVLIESGIDPLQWNPPYTPLNGETMFDDAMRSMVTGQSGMEFTIQPGETRKLDANFGLAPTWKSSACELVAFVQNMTNHKVLQAMNIGLSDLVWESEALNHPPVLGLDGGVERTITEGDTMQITFSVTDPDSADEHQFWAFYSADGKTYSGSLPAHASFVNPVFRFAPDTTQSGLYRFMLRAVDKAGANDSVRFSVQVLDRPDDSRNCDCNADGRVSLRDVLAFLLLYRAGADDPRLDWNKDGTVNLKDAIAFAGDLIAGRCPAVRSTFTSLAGSNKPDEAQAEWLRRTIGDMGLDRASEAELLAELDLLTAGTALPREYELLQNSPNPFNPSTVLTIDVPENAGDDTVLLRVFDLRGKTVRTLVNGVLSPGRHSVFWDGSDDRGRTLSSGVYFSRLETVKGVQTRKMILLR